VKQTRIVIVDNHALVRAGIRALVERITGVEVVGETGDPWEVQRLTATHRPDVLLLDIAMPGMNGFEVLDQVLKEFSDTRVIILSIYDSEEYADRAIGSGARGYLPKSAAASELETAIKAVMRGDLYLSPALSRKSATEEVYDDLLERGLISDLTPRQREVLRKIAEGQSTKEIARTLGISAKTVESHRAQLMERLGIHDIAGLVRYAIKIGLVAIEQ
jgi:DNA-binding NarL/FixJ family response regulator